MALSNWKPETWLALYAAVVATTVGAVQILNYFRSGVRLKFSLIPDGQTIGAGPELDETDLVILTVTNRGGVETTIENMFLFEYRSRWERILHRPYKSRVITNPQLKGYPSNVPGSLQPAKKWTGVIRHRADQIADLRTGNFYIGIATSHRDRPYLIGIPYLDPKRPSAPALAKADKVSSAD